MWALLQKSQKEWLDGSTFDFPQGEFAPAQTQMASLPDSIFSMLLKHVKRHSLHMHAETNCATSSRSSTSLSQDNISESAV